MTFKVYLTVEMPGEYDTKDEARDAAIETLRDAATTFDPKIQARSSLNLMRGTAVQARVFPSDTITSGAQHAFLVDIHDGCI